MSVRTPGPCPLACALWRVGLTPWPRAQTVGALQSVIYKHWDLISQFTRLRAFCRSAKKKPVHNKNSVELRDPSSSQPLQKHAPVAGNLEAPAPHRAVASTNHSTHRAAALDATREHRSAPSGDCRTPPPRATAASLQAGRARDGRYVRSVPGRMRMGRRARSEAPPKGFRVARQVQTTLAQAERHAHRMLAAGLGSDDDSRQWSEDRGDAGGGPRHLRHQAQH